MSIIVPRCVAELVDIVDADIPFVAMNQVEAIVLGPTAAALYTMPSFLPGVSCLRHPAGVIDPGLAELSFPIWGTIPLSAHMVPCTKGSCTSSEPFDQAAIQEGCKLWLENIPLASNVQYLHNSYELWQGDAT